MAAACSIACREHAPVLPVHAHDLLEARALFGVLGDLGVVAARAVGHQAVQFFVAGFDARESI